MDRKYLVGDQITNIDLFNPESFKKCNFFVKICNGLFKNVFVFPILKCNFSLEKLIFIIVQFTHMIDTKH